MRFLDVLITSGGIRKNIPISEILLTNLTVNDILYLQKFVKGKNDG